MNLTQMESFVRVAQTGSLSRAANLLRVSQPTLSRQIRLLEVDLGERLLLRTGRGVVLTEAGHCLLAHANTILSQVRTARQHIEDLKTAPAGRVSVGLTASLAKAITPELVQRFRKQFPRCAIRVTDGLSANLCEWLLDGRVDVAVLYSAGQSSKLHLETLTREELVLVRGAHGGAPLPARVLFQDLHRYPLVLPCAPNPIRMLVDVQCNIHEVRLSVIAEVDAVESLVAMTETSDCCSILPESRARDGVRDGKLSMAYINSPRVLNRLSLASSAHGTESALTRGVKQILRDLVL